MAALPRELLQSAEDVIQGSTAVDIGFALTQQVEIGAIEYKNCGHLGGSLPPGHDVREFWRNSRKLSTSFELLEFWLLIAAGLQKLASFTDAVPMLPARAQRAGDAGYRPETASLCPASPATADCLPAMEASASSTTALVNICGRTIGGVAGSAAYSR